MITQTAKSSYNILTAKKDAVGIGLPILLADTAIRAVFLSVMSPSMGGACGVQQCTPIPVSGKTNPQVLAHPIGLGRKGFKNSYWRHIMSENSPRISAPVPFSFESKEVRAVNRNGEIWFVASDVCNVLELSNPSVSLEALDDDEKAIFNLGHSGYPKNYLGYSNRGNPNVNIINESGLYALILRSRKPQAKRFRKWVTSEVLPAIRKTGAYVHNLDMLTPITSEQQEELRADIRSITCSWLKLQDQWIYNHLRVAFNVSKFEHIPQKYFHVAKMLIASKKEATSQLLGFIRELKEWFSRECLGADTPWTPSIQKELTKKLKRQVTLPPKVDWLALAEEAPCGNARERISD